MKAVWNSKYFFWFLLMLPSIGFMVGLWNGTTDFHKLLHPTGEFSARFMILAMLVSPFMIIWKDRRWPRWLMARRRYLGVAAFLYGLLHTAFYILDKGGFDPILAEALELGIWTGWVAILIFVPLGLTSNDYAVRRLGPGWKMLQRLTYLAALLTLAHWVFIHYKFGGAAVHFGILVVFEAWRIVKQQQRAQGAVT